jgi:hypothetical protein
LAPSGFFLNKIQEKHSFNQDCNVIGEIAGTTQADEID